MDGSAWLNTAKYSVPMLVLFGLGCLGWAIAYAGTLWTIRNRRFVEIPAAAVVANVAWELLWGFVFKMDLGLLFVWGYRLWFFLDVFITWNLFKYGAKQVANPILRRWFAPAAAFGIAAWAALLYFFVRQGLDNSFGGISGYILNVMMSAFYLVMLAQLQNLRDISPLVGWSKMLGTAVFSVFNFLLTPQNGFLMTLCVVTFLLDAAYVAAYHARAARERAAGYEVAGSAAAAAG
jgi:hypothetical protein